MSEPLGTKENPWHFTSLEEYMYCPRKWLYGQTVGEPIYSWYALRGTIIHKTFEEGMERFSKIFHEEIEKTTQPIHVNPKLPASPEFLAKEHDTLSALLPHYWRVLKLFQIKILEREKQMSMCLPLEMCKGLKCGKQWFTGTVDAIAIHPDTPDGMVEIHDYKSGRKWPQEALNRKLQFGGYYMLARQNGYNVNRVFWGHVQGLEVAKSNTKSGVLKGEYKNPFFYGVVITERDLAFVLEQALHVIHGIEAGVFPWASSGADAPCGMCPYAMDVCPSFETGNRNDIHLEKMMDAIVAKRLRENHE